MLRTWADEGVRRYVVRLIASYSVCYGGRAAIYGRVPVTQHDQVGFSPDEAATILSWPSLKFAI